MIKKTFQISLFIVALAFIALFPQSIATHAEELDSLLQLRSLGPGESVMVRNVTSSNATINIGGPNDNVSYDPSGNVTSFSVDHRGGNVRVSSNQSLAITNRSTTSYVLDDRSNSFVFMSRTNPAVLRWTLQKDRSLEAVNIAQRNLSIRPSHNYYEYAFFNSQGDLDSYGKYSTTSKTVSPSEKLLLTNYDDRPLEVPFPFDGFTVGASSTPVMFYETLQNGQSVQVTNTTNKSFRINIEGAYDFARYDANGDVASYGKNVTTSSILVASGGSLTVTKSSSGSAEVSGPQAAFAINRNSNPALFSINMYTGQSIEAVNITGSTSGTRLDGAGFDYAIYDSSNEILSYTRDASASNVNVRVGQKIALTNMSNTWQEFYAPYEAFHITQRTHPVSFTLTLAPNQTIRAVNTSNNRLPVFLNGQHHYAVYNENDVREYGYPTSAGSYNVRDTDHIIVSNSGVQNIRFSGPYDAFALTEQTEPALYKAYLSSNQSISLSSSSSSSFRVSLDGTYDQASYRSDWNVRSFAHQDSGEATLFSGERMTVTNSGGSLLTLLAPNKVVIASPSSTPALALRVLRPRESVEFLNLNASSSEQVRFRGQHDLMEFTSDGLPHTYVRNRTLANRSVSRGEKLALMNTDDVPITAYAAYEVFEMIDREDPVTFRRFVAPGSSIDVTNEANSLFSIYTDNPYSFAQYNEDGDATSVNRSYTSRSNSIAKGNRVSLTNDNSSSMVVEGPFDVFSLANRTNPALITKTLSPRENAEIDYIGPNRASVYMTGQYDYSLFDRSGNLDSYSRNNTSFLNERVENGERLAVMNSGSHPIDIYGAYDVFQVRDRENPVTFRYSLGVGRNIEIENQALKNFSLYFNGTYDYAKFNSNRSLQAFNSDVTSNVVMNAGDLSAISNSAQEVVTIEGAFDAFNITTRANPALLKYMLNPGESMEARYTGSDSDYIRYTGRHDLALYDSNGVLDSYYHQRGTASSTRERIRVGEKVAIMNSDSVPIKVFGAYDVFQHVDRQRPVTFSETLSFNNTSLEISNRLDRQQYIYLNGTYDWARFNNDGEVRSFDQSDGVWRQAVTRGNKLILSPAEGSSVTVSGPYDGFNLSPRSERALIKRDLQPNQTYSFWNISPSSFSVRILGRYSYEIYDSAGNLLRSGANSTISSRTVGSNERIVITNIDVVPFLVYAPRDAISEAGDIPDRFTRIVRSGESIQTNNTSNSTSQLTITGRYDVAIYNSQGQIVDYVIDSTSSPLNISSGHRAIITSKRSIGTTVQGNLDSFQVNDHQQPALTVQSLRAGRMLSATNLGTSSRTLKVEGTFTYFASDGIERTGSSPLTVAAGETMLIKNTSRSSSQVYSPFGYFSFEAIDSPGLEEAISGLAAVERIRKLDPAKYDELTFYADPVDTATGAQIINRTLITAHGVVPIPFQVQYHSLLTGDGILGKGWSHQYQIRLDVNDEDNEATIYWNDFRSNTFEKQSNGEYTSDETAIKLDRLVVRNGLYRLERNNGTNYTFNVNGKVVAIEDKTDFLIRVEYNSSGEIARISDSMSGAALTFSYNSQGLLSSVADQAQRTAYYHYDDQNRLVEMIDPAGLTTQYIYDSEDRIVEGISEGLKIFSNIFDDEGRVISQQDAIPDNPPTLFEYIEADGWLTTTITDRNGNVQIRIHDSSYQLIRVEDELGRITSNEYDEEGNRISTTNALDQTTTFVYDQQGNLLESTDHVGQKILMTYDSNNNLLTVTGPDGNTLQNEYDSKNRLIAVTDANGQTTRYEYNAGGLMLYAIDPLGATTTYKYNGGHLAAVFDDDYRVTLFGYDLANRLVSESDAEGNLNSRVYNENDQVISETDAFGQTVTYEYNNQGFLAKETDAKGNVWEYEYDGNGQLTKIINPLNESTLFRYDGEGRLLETIDAKGNSTLFTYDAKGNLLTETNALGETVRYVYDNLDRIIEIYDANDVRIHAVTYDEAGNPIETTNALDHTSTSLYNQLNLITQTIDPLQRSTSFAYDRLNRVVEVIDPLQGSSSQTYDPLSRITSYTDPNGNTTFYTYDSTGRLISEVNAAGGNHTYSYNSIGLLGSETNGRGQVTTYEYEGGSRLKQLTDLLGSINYTYDEKGNPTVVSEGGKSLTRAYDELDRVIEYTDDNGHTMLYEYDENGQLSKLTYPDGKTVNYTYDAAGRMKTVTDWDNRVTEYHYDVNGRLISTHRPNGTIEKRTYDAAGQLLTLIDERADGSIINEYVYSYDEVGNVITEFGGVEQGDTELVFDIDGPGLSPGTPIGATYSQAPFSSENVTMTYSADNRLATYNGDTVRYDEDGNLTYGPLNGIMQEFSYDARNRLTEAGGVSYGYNSENIRTSITVDGETTTYVVNPHAILSQLLMEVDANGNPIAYYVHGLGLIGREDASGNYRTYHFDRRGSTVALTDEAGNITDTYEYGYYGEPLGHEGETEQPFRYNGRDGVMTDPNGLYQMRARYYNPEIKRFMNRDVVIGSIQAGQTLNRYAYVNGNPISYIDPFGLSRDGDSIWLQAGDFLIDLTPIFGTIKGIQQAVTGYNLVTGKNLTTAERWGEGIGAAIGVIPGLKKVGSELGTKFAGWLGKGNPGNIVRLGEDGINYAISNSRRMQHAFKHAEDLGFGNWNKQTAQQWNDYVSDVLRTSTKSFDNSLGQDAVKGFYKVDANGYNVAAYIYKNGPNEGRIASVVRLTDNQMNKFGLK